VIYCGIDETGYGPILGPLIVTSTVFSVPDKDDLWFLLREIVSKRKKGLGNRLLVTDSKKAFSQATGIKHLERTTLAFLDQLNLKLDTFSHLLAAVSLDANTQLQRYPWYSKVHENLLYKKDITATTKLAEVMKKQKIDLLDVRCCYFDVIEFNRRVQSTGNKAEMVTSSVIELIQSAVALASFLNEKQVFVVSDRLGGRVYYEELLERIPGFCLVSKNSCPVEVSEYKLESKSVTLDVRFEVEADNNYFPVSLSSVIGKYLREVIMQCMNEFFVELQPGLRPTAGYYVDGSRFLKELKSETLKSCNLSRGVIMRIK